VLAWTTPLADAGVGDSWLRALSRLSIATVGDLLRHLPLRYEQEEAETPIAALAVETIGSARGLLVAVRWVPRMGRRLGRFEARLKDDTGLLQLTWFNASYLRDKLPPGDQIRVQGKVVHYRGGLQIVNPRWEILRDEPAARSARLRPVYPATENLTSRMIERVVHRVLPRALSNIQDPLPGDLCQQRCLPALADAYRALPQPRDLRDIPSARDRLAYNELLLLELGIVLKRRHVRTNLAAPPLRTSPAIDAHIRARFPFSLTAAQERVVREIAADLSQAKPMNRLLQGDVGSGKTVVALYALLLAVADRRQGALMAPTELLAEQHFASISAMLAGSDVRIALLTGGRSAAGSPQRRAELARIARGKADIVVGTQALLTDQVRFKSLAVVVVDEQHRFGVLQRAAFRQRMPATPAGDGGATKPPSPHYLVMTATPIPRTLSLTVFGDLDVSVIDQLPPGRTPIQTRVVTPQQADRVYRYLARRVAAGEQAYVVVPTIDESGAESPAQLKNVRVHARLLQDKYFAPLAGSSGGPRVGAVHGRMKRATRALVMERFRRGQIQVLVATTVIEVGVDVPNATVMVVEHAERFGLAQLHQLRGRIGRGAHGRPSLCVFIAEPQTPDAQQRLEAIAATTDGFQIAERDLAIRGMGDFFGTRQHGLPPLRVARIPQDMPLLSTARRDAEALIAAAPALAAPAHHLQRRALQAQYGRTFGLNDVA